MATVYSDVITTTALSDAMRTVYSADLEFIAGSDNIFDQFAEIKGEFKAERGEQVVWTIYRNTAPAIAQLTENQDVDARRISEFQVSFTVHEYGTAYGTTEKLDLLSYHGKISEIVRDQLAPHMGLTTDILARNAAWAGAPTSYVGQTTRAALTAANVATIATVKSAAFGLSKNRVPLRGGDYVCVAHPAIIYDLKEDTEWEQVGTYSDPSRLLSGEIGRIRGVRFIESHVARLPNAGSTGSPVETALTVAGSTNASAKTLTMTDTTGIVAGDEITLFEASQTLPDGTGELEESVVVASVTSGTVLVLKQRLLLDHAIGTKVRKAPDIYPMMFLGGQAPYGKGIVLAPEVRVALPTDKLRRISYVGWYGLFGYGTLRDWTYSVTEACASQDSSYQFSW